VTSDAVLEERQAKAAGKFTILADIEAPLAAFVQSLSRHGAVLSHDSSSLSAGRCSVIRIDPEFRPELLWTLRSLTRFKAKPEPGGHVPQPHG